MPGAFCTGRLSPIHRRIHPIVSGTIVFSDL